jgi:hypothetical protein
MQWRNDAAILANAFKLRTGRAMVPGELGIYLNRRWWKAGRRPVKTLPQVIATMPQPSVDPLQSRSLALQTCSVLGQTMSFASYPLTEGKRRVREYKRLNPFATHINLGWLWNDGPPPRDGDNPCRQSRWKGDIENPQYARRLLALIAYCQDEQGLIVNFWCFGDDSQVLLMSRYQQKIWAFKQLKGFHLVKGLIVTSIELDEWMKKEADQIELGRSLGTTHASGRILYHFTTGVMKTQGFWNRVRPLGVLGLALQHNKTDQSGGGFTTTEAQIRRDYQALRRRLPAEGCYSGERTFKRSLQEAQRLEAYAATLFKGTM